VGGHHPRPEPRHAAIRPAGADRSGGDERRPHVGLRPGPRRQPVGPL